MNDRWLFTSLTFTGLSQWLKNALHKMIAYLSLVYRSLGCGDMIKYLKATATGEQLTPLPHGCPQAQV